jgi:hypothetical protein
MRKKNSFISLLSIINIFLIYLILNSCCFNNSLINKKMKILKFKQIISDILSLKSKTLTILLGTIVPFFACHILASAGKKVRGRYLPYFIMFFVLTSIAYAFLIALIMAMGINLQSLSVLDISFLVIISGLYCGFNYLITILFYGLIQDIKKRELTEQSNL